MKNKCCFCKDDMGKFGNNAEPLKMKARCCDWCNYYLVLPFRIRLYVIGTRLKK